MKGYPRSLLGILAVALVALPLSAGPVQAAMPRLADACTGAGTATNAVIRFYLAVSSRQLAAAYACFTGDEQARLPYATFVQGYVRTLSSHLAWADSEVPNGTPVDHVAIELHAVDRVGSTLVAATFTGYWQMSSSDRLVDGHIQRAAAQTVPAIPRLDVARIFAGAGRVILAHVRADVTGDGMSDDIYITSGAGCGSCHAQQVWIYSADQLVFAQQVDDAEVRVARHGTGFELRTDTPNSPGLDSCCPSERTYEEWAWTPYGFTLTAQHIVASSQSSSQ